MLLQSCEGEGEIIEVIYWYLPRLFPRTQGRVFLNDERSGQLVSVFAWPEKEDAGNDFPVKDCSALLEGTAVDVFESQKKACIDCGCGGLCTPFRQAKDAFGLFCLHGTQQDALSSRCKGLAFITTEYLSMAISNIRLKRKLRELTIMDPLTSLYNRRYMGDVLAREIKKAKRSKASLGMIMVDLDYFKRINDRFGHDAGDEVLKRVAALLKAEVRSEDVVCRFLGGGIFYSAGHWGIHKLSCAGRAVEREN
ncbi:MAG: GGDEF domain-containing protein [Desulfobacter sp.]|nr:MAG: GGDEF domain-containing protein [Desulfobacter sp.]